jgi:branched-chain amino acid transport system permease protein
LGTNFNRLLLFSCVCLAILSLFPIFFGKYMLIVLILIFIDIILVSSLRASMNAGQLNFGIPAFMAIGAYTSSLMMMKLGSPFIIGFLAGGLLAALVSLFIGYPSLKLKGVYFLILTLGFVEIIRFIVMRWASLTGGGDGLNNIPPAGIMGVSLTTEFDKYYFTLCVMALILAILYRLENSRFGLTVKCISQSDDLCEAVGINTYIYKILSFVISSFFAGLAGSLYAHDISFIQPFTFSFSLAALLLVYYFVGGQEGFIGPVLGVIFLSLLSEPLRPFRYYEKIFYGIIMIVVVLFLPSGLIGLREKLFYVFGRYNKHDLRESNRL